MKKKQLSDKIRIARAKSRMSQSDLARKAGVAPSTIYLLENENNFTKPSVITICKIANALDLDTNELVSLLEG